MLKDSVLSHVRIGFCAVRATLAYRQLEAVSWDSSLRPKLFAEIGYELDTMTAIAEPRRFQRLTAGQLSRTTRRAPHQQREVLMLNLAP
jgi:hypothetical protein